MSRTYQNPPAATSRRPPATRSLPRPSHPPPPPPPASTARGGVRASTHARTMRTQPPRQERDDYNPSNENNGNNQQERTIHTGEGFHMIAPSTTKHEQIRRQAENEQRQYEAHLERTRLHDIHEVHRLGGDGLSEDEVRRRQAEKYRRDKFERLEKTHRDQIQKKQEEEKDIAAKKQTARLQSMENEKRDRNGQSNRGATGWTNETREEDRQKTMDRFLNRLTDQCDENEKNTPNDLSKSEKLSILRATLPQIDEQTLERYLEIYNGDVDTVVDELLN